MSSADTCKKDLYLDLLCFESVLALLFYRNHIAIVHFFQVSKAISAFIPIIEKIVGVPLIQINDFVSSENRINDNNVYEIVQNRLSKILEEYSKEWISSGKVGKLIAANGFNPGKVSTFFKYNAFAFFYRPIEINYIAQIISGDRGHCFLIQKSIFSSKIEKEMEGETHFYRLVFSRYLKIKNRKDNHYDNIVSSAYYSPSKLRTLWLVSKAFFKSNIIGLNDTGSSKSIASPKYSKKIGVELLQSRVRLDEINDLFWTKSPEISPYSVVAIEDHNSLLDAESLEILKEQNIQRIPYEQIRSVFGNTGFLTIFNPFKYRLHKNILGLFSLICSITFKLTEKNWLWVYCLIFESHVLYWKKVYSELKIHILFSMLDGGAVQQPKSQAIEDLNGIYAGCHWSNFPFVGVLNNKCYDVLLTWSNYFSENIFLYEKYLEVFTVGYPSDHYFKDHASQAKALKNEYSGNFIISYHDNITNNDLPNSLNIQVTIHLMLLDLLERNSNLILFLKPKRAFSFEKIKNILPQLNGWIQKGRIRVFLGDNERTKAVPALIGMASDLVIGLGISTAAAECYFAGTLAYHADFTKVNNDFGVCGRNKVVFKDITSLGSAIQDCIENGTQKKYWESNDVYNLLDPFQDGKAYQRIGFILNSMHELLGKGMSRQDVINTTKNSYENFYGQSENNC
jgi:hypothetical protein